MVSLVVGGRRAWAGGYDVTYSASDPATFQNPHNSGTDNYSGSDPFSVNSGCNWGLEQDSNGNIVSTSGECHATATLTAHFVWHPSYTGELPPKCAIVYETASAAYFLGPGSKYHGGSGNCASTLDHETTVPNIVNQTLVSEVKNSYRYSIKQDPGYSFDKTCTPTANAQGTGMNTAEYSGSGQARISVSYKAQAAPVELGLSGTTKVAGYDNILIGQKCTASIGCVLVTLTGHQWSIPGEIYGGFGVTYDENGKIQTGGPIDLPSDLLTQASPSWYWKKDLGATVECSASATVTATGETIGQVAASRYVSVQSPDSDIRTYMGTVQLTSGSPTIPGGLLGLFGSGVDGMRSSAWAKTPDMFVANGASWGNIQYVQIATDYINWTDSSGITHFGNRNGHTGLDDGGSNLWWMYGLATFADGSWLDVSDSPAIDLNSLLNVVSCYRTFDAQTWVMYLPPGDSSWVPLWKFIWGFDSAAQGPVVTNSQWGSWQPSVSGSPYFNGHNWLPAFPAWTEVISQTPGFTP